MKQWGGDQNYRPEKHDKDKKRRRRADRDNSERRVKEPKVESQDTPSERDYRVGRTIAGDTNTERQQSLEHIAARKKKLRRNIIIFTGVAAAIALVLAGIARSIAENVTKSVDEAATSKPQYPTEPTVAIVDENVGNNISSRVRVFVARLEADATEYGLKVDHVLLPFKKAREIDVYFEGRKEFYRMTTERGSTVQIEDASRLVRYLDGKGLAPEYVDIRVAGKAYYK